MRKVHRVLLVVVVAAVTSGAGVAVSPMADAGQYFEVAISGSGTNTGTAAELYTWSSWSVPENPSHPCTNTSNGYCASGPSTDTRMAKGLQMKLSGCLIQPTDNSNSLEVGFSSGYNPGVNGGCFVRGVTFYVPCRIGFWRSAGSVHEVHRAGADGHAGARRET